MAKTKITKELLIADGWVETPQHNPICMLEKKIENINPLNASEDTDISLIIHGMYNGTQLAIELPDGGMLNFTCKTMEQLKQFEKCILFYDAPF